MSGSCLPVPAGSLGDDLIVPFSRYITGSYCSYQDDDKDSPTSLIRQHPPLIEHQPLPKTTHTESTVARHCETGALNNRLGHARHLVKLNEPPPFAPCGPRRIGATSSSPSSSIPAELANNRQTTILRRDTFLDLSSQTLSHGLPHPRDRGPSHPRPGPRHPSKGTQLSPGSQSLSPRGASRPGVPSVRQ